MNQVAWAQTTTVCHAAAVKGTDGPIDYGAYCWIDFSPLNLGQAKSGSGQNFRVNLQGGAYLTFTLRIVSGNAAGTNMFARPVPSWTGAAFGNSAFNSIPGNPILYQDVNNQNGPQNTVTLSSITLHANGSTDLPFVFVAGDGESSNGGETLSFTTTGQAWTLISAPGESNPGLNMPVLTPPTAVGNSTGSQTVDIDGVAGNVGSYVFTTDNSPGTVTAELEGNGLQGVIFGLKYHSIGLSLTKSHVGNFIVGGTGTYTIDVANTVVQPQVNPPSEPQPVRVVDTLPAGLTYASASGTGWSCSNVGQVVTCNTTSLQDLTYSRTFPPISIGVTVDMDAASPLVNSAVVSDPTTTTLVFNVCETEDNGVCPNSATNTTGDETIILRPDLSDVTKTVSDRNGGDAEPGDVLRYTITVQETGGVAATGVSVVDDLGPNLGNLSVVSIPAGSTDASNPGGGANGTGQLNITGISVAANGTFTVVFDATIAGSADEGDEIDNTVTINNPGGVGGTADAETVTVLESSLPQPPGTKYLYLHNAGGGPTPTLRRQLPTANTYEEIEGDDDELTWVLTPAIPSGETLVLPEEVAGNLLMRASGNSTGNNRTVRAHLVIDRATGPDTVLDSDANNVSGTNVVIESYEFELPSNVALRTLNPGDVLELRIVNEVNQSSRDIRVYQRNGTNWPNNYSFLTFDTPTVINVDAVSVHSQPASSGNSTKAAYIQGDHAYIRATVSDPFGTADISNVSVVIKDPTGAIIVPSATMTALADTNTSDGSRSYEYDFIVPANPDIGGWTATVTAKEGVEDLVQDTANVGFVVHGRVQLGKTWGTGAINGNVVTLAIAGGATQTGGTSTAGGSTTPATAASAEGVTLTFTEAFTTGTAGSYSISMACSRDKDSAVVTANGTGPSRTITMPGDSAVTCAFVNTLTIPLTVVKLSSAYSDPINGTTNPKAIPGALVSYRINVIAPEETSVDADSIILHDPIPAQVVLFVDDLPDHGGTSPFIWTPGGSGLGFTFAGLGASDDVEFSDDNGGSWGYEPVPDADGVDGNVTNVRFRPKGSMAAGSNFWLEFRVLVK